MRKIVLALAMSLDGYIARENGDVDWLAMEDLSEGADEMKEFFASVDTVLTGRKTYEKGLEMSGGELAQTFFEHGLIDEIILGIQAKIIGSGIPLFLPHKQQTDLELISIKTRKSGSVQISCRVKR